ncbi:MAG TPA: MASE1 domain-containing protein [Gemmatimonadales bacterium]|nr:MASE1 domain-containing protein [Gemmatimonadales bacterium]
MSARLLRNAALLVGLAAVYFVAGKLGLRLASVNASATAVWAPTGIALAAFLMLGYRVWPAILLSAFLVNVTTAGSVMTSISIGAGNTLEGIVGAYLVNRFANGRNALQRAPDVFKFAAVTSIVGTMVSATCGVTSLALAGFADWARYGSIWLTWWLGDAAGALVVAPFVILWSASPHPRWRGSRVFEAALLVLSLSFVGAIVFGGLFPSDVKNYPLEFLCLPLLIWAAFRFGPREVATAVAMLSGIATWGTLHGFGPFARNAQNESLLLLQTFMAVTALTTLALAAVVSERRGAEKRLRRLTVRDPLTGLGNYRRLIAALEGEIGRSQRTERPFALLFLDLDDLKGINDRHGHLTGNRALCRVAHALSVSCRSMDTAARFGGDEFALVMPETREAAARQVARRIGDDLAVDPELPVLSLSVGVAEYPRDGETVEALLGVADHGLYEVKAGRVARYGVRPRGAARRASPVASVVSFRTPRKGSHR